MVIILIGYRRFYDLLIIERGRIELNFIWMIFGWNWTINRWIKSAAFAGSSLDGAARVESSTPPLSSSSSSSSSTCSSTCSSSARFPSAPLAFHSAKTQRKRQLESRLSLIGGRPTTATTLNIEIFSEEFDSILCNLCMNEGQSSSCIANRNHCQYTASLVTCSVLQFHWIDLKLDISLRLAMEKSISKLLKHLNHSEIQF